MSSASSNIRWNGKQQSFGQSVRSAQYYAMPPSGTPPNTIWINLIPMHSFLNTSSSYLQLIGFPIYFPKHTLPNNHRGTLIIFKPNLKQVSTDNIHACTDEGGADYSEQYFLGLRKNPSGTIS